MTLVLLIVLLTVWAVGCWALLYPFVVLDLIEWLSYRAACVWYYVKGL